MDIDPQPKKGNNRRLLMCMKRRDLSPLRTDADFNMTRTSIWELEF